VKLIEDHSILVDTRKGDTHRHQSTDSVTTDHQLHAIGLLAVGHLVLLSIHV